MLLNSVNTIYTSHNEDHHDFNKKIYVRPVLEEFIIEMEEVIAASGNDDLDDGGNNSNPGGLKAKSSYQMSWNNKSFED